MSASPQRPPGCRTTAASVTALVAVDKADLGEPVGRLPDRLMDEVERGLWRVLGLWRLLSAHNSHAGALRSSISHAWSSACQAILRAA